jgi:hypothetical protein
VDSNDDGSGELFAWSLVTWTDVLAGGAQDCDARAEDGSGPTLVSDWNEPPASADQVVDEAAGGAPTLALVPNPVNRPPTPDAHFFRDVATAAGREVVGRRGNLDARTVPNVALTCASAILTGAGPARLAGEVVTDSVAADEDLSHVWLSWLDTRDGAARVYFKRTDTLTFPVDLLEAGPAPCSAGGGLRVTWRLPASPPHCDVDHVRLEHGPAPGSYTASVDVDGTEAVIGALTPGSRVYVRAITVDEACNEIAAREVSGLVADCSASPLCPNPVGATLRAAKSASLDVLLSWQPPPVDAGHHAADSYDVYRSTTLPGDGFGRIAEATPATGLADLAAAAPGSATPLHFYLVVARNACGTSGDEPQP